jgi:hypothetical protein
VRPRRADLPALRGSTPRPGTKWSTPLVTGSIGTVTSGVDQEVIVQRS